VETIYFARFVSCFARDYSLVAVRCRVAFDTFIDVAFYVVSGRFCEGISVSFLHGISLSLLNNDVRQYCLVFLINVVACTREAYSDVNCSMVLRLRRAHMTVLMIFALLLTTFSDIHSIKCSRRHDNSIFDFLRCVAWSAGSTFVVVLFATPYIFVFCVSFCFCFAFVCVSMILLRKFVVVNGGCLFYAR